MSEEFSDCGIDGKDDSAVKVGAFNRVLRRIGVAHLLPLKENARTMREHMDDCAKQQARIMGGVTVLLVMVPVATGIVVGLVLAISKKWFGL